MTARANQIKSRTRSIACSHLIRPTPSTFALLTHSYLFKSSHSLRYDVVHVLNWIEVLRLFMDLVIISAEKSIRSTRGRGTQGSIIEAGQVGRRVRSWPRRRGTHGSLFEVWPMSVTANKTRSGSILTDVVLVVVIRLPPLLWLVNVNWHNAIVLSLSLSLPYVEHYHHIITTTHTHTHCQPNLHYWS